jgi:hypothetical protein
MMKVGLLVEIEAKVDKQEELAAFIADTQPTAAAEPGA